MYLSFPRYGCYKYSDAHMNALTVLCEIQVTTVAYRSIAFIELFPSNYDSSALTPNGKCD